MFRIGTTLFFAGSARVLYVPPSRMGPSGLRRCSPPSGSRILTAGWSCPRCGRYRCGGKCA